MAETGLLSRPRQRQNPVIRPEQPSNPALPPPTGETTGLLRTRTPRPPTTGGEGTGGTPPTPPTGTPPSTLGKPSSDPAAELNRLLAQDSPLLQDARTRGMQYANQRGLLNSSIGGSAAEAEMIRAAQPLALQGAGQVAASELSGQQFGQQQKLQTQAEAAQKGIATMNVTSNEKIAALDAATQEKVAAANNATQLSVANLSAETQKAISSMNADTQIALGNLEAGTQTAIANMNVASNQQANAMSAAVGMSGNEAQMWAAVLNNPNIPAAERAKYLTSIQATTNANIGLIEQIYNVDLSWTTPGSTPTPTPLGLLAPPTVQPSGITGAVANIANTVAGNPPA